MAKVISVAKARKDQGTCHRSGCTTEIKAGDAYKHVTLKTGPRSSLRRVWCTIHNPRSSETTTARIGQVWVIGERLSDELENGSMKTLADIWDLLTNAVSDIENIRDEFQDGLDNMPEGLQQGDTGQLIQERIDGLEEWLQELNTAADEINEMDPDGETGSDESETECATCGFTKLQHAADYALDLIPERTHDPCGTWLNPEVLEAAAEMAAEAAGSCSL